MRAGSGARWGIVTQHDLRIAFSKTEAASTDAEAPSVCPRLVAVQGVRRAVAEKMVTSRREIPDVFTWVRMRRGILGLLAVGRRSTPCTAHDGDPVAVVLRACVAGSGIHPRLNARYQAERQEIEELGAVHLGVAVQTERGLVVPVIRDVHTWTTLEIGGGAPAPLRRSTRATRSDRRRDRFAVHGLQFRRVRCRRRVAIVNHPEAAILGVGRFAEKPWVVDGALVVRNVVELSLSFDHRIMDGADAGGFLRFVADCVEQPAPLLAHA